MLQVTQRNRLLSFFHGNLLVDQDHKRVINHEIDASLTRTEFQLLLILVQNPHRIVSNEELLDRVWGPGRGYDELLRLNIYRLRKKIEPNPSKPRYIKNCRGQGYYFEL